jgi:O-antigen/teichoic acid export membrane protein
MKLLFFEGDIIRRGALVFLATFFASIIAFFANLIISKMLGPESFGIFKTVIYLFAFLPALADLGINASLTKYIAEFGKDSGKVKYLIKWFLKIKVVSFVLLIIIVFLLKDSIAVYFLKDISLNYLVIGGILFIASSFFSIFSSIMLGLQDFKLFSLSQFLNSVSSALLAVLLSPLGIFYMILGWSLGPFIGSLPIMFFLLKKRVFSGYEKTDLKRIFFKFSLPIYSIELSATLFSVIVPFLSLFFSQRLIGYYSFAFMFYFVTTLIPSSLSTVLFPKISELNGLKKHGDAKNILKRIFLYYSLIVILGLAFVFLLSEWFINLIAKDYLPSLLVFKVIVSLGLVFGYNAIYTIYLKGLGRVKKYAFFVLLQNAFLIIVSFILLNSMI